MSTIWQIPINGGEPKKLFSNPPENIYSVDWSPDGKRLALVQGQVTSKIVLLKRREENDSP
jgi:WD40 repeat protein